MDPTGKSPCRQNSSTDGRWGRASVAPSQLSFGNLTCKIYPAKPSTVLRTPCDFLILFGRLLRHKGQNLSNVILS